MGSQPSDESNDRPGDWAESSGVPPGVPEGTEQVSGGSVADDRLLIDRLIEAHHAALYRYAYRLSGSATDAEDLVQQVFMTACRKLDQVREPEHVTAWLYAVLRSCFLKSCRKPVPQSAGAMEMNLDHLPGDVPPPQEVDSDQLQQALDALPPEYRLVVVMYYYEHCSYKQIADQLSLPMGTVMSRLARAKQRLRALLAEPDESPVRLPKRGGPHDGPTLQRAIVEPGRP